MDPWVVDLAPRHKMGLPLTSRVIIAAGISRLGFPTQIPYNLDGVGAIITGPWTWVPHWEQYPILIERPGAILWTPPRPPRSPSKVLRQLTETWQRWPVAVVGALAPGETAHIRDAARHLSEAVSALLVESAPDEDLSAVLARITTAADVSELPTWVALPLERAREWAQPCVHAGADALLIGMPPEGIWPRGEHWVRGRVYSPALLPIMLAALRDVVPLVDGAVPLIAQGGIHSPEDAIRCREAGADAVALDAAVWVEPDLPKRVAEALHAWDEEHLAEEAEDDASSHPASE